MRCSKCGAENPEKAKFCVECASILAALCGYADKAGSAPSRVCVLNFGIYETSER